MKHSTKYTALFSITWFLIFVFYPFWLMEINFYTRLKIFSFSLILTVIATFLINLYFKKKLDTEKEKKSFKLDKYLALLILFVIVLQAYALTFPILTQSDESTHVERGLYIYEPINSLFLNLGIPTQLISWVVLILVIFLIIKLKDSEKLKNLLIKYKYLIIFLFIILSIIYFLFLSNFANSFVISKFGEYNIKYFDWLMWYGPLAAIASSIPLFFFGIHEIASRLVPIIFYIFSAIFLYKLVTLYRTKKEALISVAFLSFFPIYFHWVHIAELTAGEIFFIIISMYYLLRYEKLKQFSDLILMAFFAGISVAYKNNCLYIFLIFNVFWFVKYFLSLKFKEYFDIKKFFKENKNYIITSFIALATIVPELVLMQIYRIRHLNIVLSHWLEFDKATWYLQILPEQITLPFTLIFLVSFIYCIYKSLTKKEIIYLLPIIWFSVIYFSWTSEMYLGHIRFTVPYLPAIAIMCTLLIGDLVKSIRIKNVLFIGLIIYLVFTSTYLTYNHWQDRYPPMNEMFSYIKENISEDAKILRTMAPNPYKYYIAKYDLPQYFEHNIWTEPKIEINTTKVSEPQQPTTADKQTVENLYEFCINNNFTYVLFISPQKGFDTYYELNATWYQTHDFIDSNKPWVTYVNANVILELENMTSGKFLLEKQFTSGRNKIFLSRVNYEYK